MEFEFRLGGEAPKYATNDFCTLKLHHGGIFENGVYKKGKVFYLDNVVEDFLSLLDLRKIGRGLGYDVDVSQVQKSLEISYRNVEGGLELLTSDAKVVEMVGQMPSNKVIVLYYNEVEICNGIGSQPSVEWPSLDNRDYEYDADTENCGRDVNWPFIDELLELPNEEVGTQMEIEDVGVELPDEDGGEIEDAGAELPDQDGGANEDVWG